MSQRAVNFAQEAGHQGEGGFILNQERPCGEAFLRNAPAAKRSAMAALELAKNREVQLARPLHSPSRGDSSEAQTLANDLERNFPEDTSVRFNHVPSVRALLALNHGEPSQAIEVLQTAVPNELGQPRSAINGFFGALYPVYVRGEAYMAARQGAEAVTEFQKILDHRGAVVGDPIGALAHLQVGRAYALSGDQTKAKIAYQDFLTLWKDADPGIPVLQQAKAEFRLLVSVPSRSRVPLE